MGTAAQACFQLGRIRIDIETCSACGGAMKVIACIEDSVVIKQIRSAGPARSPEAQSRNQRDQGVTRKPGATG